MNLYITSDFDGHVQLWAGLPTYSGLEWSGKDWIAGWGKYAAGYHKLPVLEPGEIRVYELVKKEANDRD